VEVMMSFPEILQHALTIAKILALSAATIAIVVLTVKTVLVLKWLARKLERDRDNGGHLADLLMRSMDLPHQAEKTLKSADEALWAMKEFPRPCR
jgi:hypothetical protein